MKTLNQRFHDAYEKAKEELIPARFQLVLQYITGTFEGLLIVDRKAVAADIKRIEDKVDSLIADQRAEAGVCVHCGGGITCFMPTITKLSFSPPDPIESCVECGREVD